MVENLNLRALANFYGYMYGTNTLMWKSFRASLKQGMERVSMMGLVRVLIVPLENTSYALKVNIFDMQKMWLSGAHHT